MWKTDMSRIRFTVLVFMFSALMVTASCGDDSTSPADTRTEVIDLSETSLDFTTDVGDPAPASQIVWVTNTGPGTLDNLGTTISYGSGQPNGWLSAILGGTVAPADLTVLATTGGGALASGIYDAVISVASNAANNSPQHVDITFMVLTKYGRFVEYATGSSHSPNILLGSKIAIPEACTLTHLCVIGKTAGPQLKIGLYSESGGQPSQLVASAPATALIDGELEIAVTPTEIPSGNYWFMVVYNTTASPGYLNTGDPNDQVKHTPLTFSSDLPATFPTPTTYTGQLFNYYVKVALN